MKFHPTDEHRSIVRALRAAGMTEEGIASAIFNPIHKKPIDLKTLRKYFKLELDQSHAQAVAKVFASLFTNATVHNNVAAQIFFLKTRAGFREVQPVEVTGKDGAPLAGAPVYLPALLDTVEWEKQAIEAQERSAERAAKLAKE